MKFYMTIGVLSLALALVFALPAMAQGGNPPAGHDQTGGNTAVEQGSSDNMVPGTGLTMAELKQLGYSQKEIASIREESGEGLAASAKSPNNLPAGTDRDRDKNAQPQRSESNAGGSGWGAWGLLGLFGLFGLAGRGRAQRVEDVRPEVRRAA